MACAKGSVDGLDGRTNRRDPDAPNQDEDCSSGARDAVSYAAIVSNAIYAD